MKKSMFFIPVMLLSALLTAILIILSCVKEADDSDPLQGMKIETESNDDMANKEPGTSSAMLTPKAGLVAFYPFNGNTDDESGNENHGTRKGVIFTKDRFGNPDAALFFSNAPGNETDAESYVEIADVSILHMEGPFSLCTWIRTTYSDYEPVNVLGKAQSSWYYNSWVIWYRNTSLSFALGNGWEDLFLYGDYPQDQEWHFVSCLYDGTVASLYLDGIKCDSDTLWSVIGYDDHSLYIGADDNDGNYTPDAGWTGEIDDVRIYNICLSEDEIAALFNE